MNIAKWILILAGIYYLFFNFNTDPIKYSLALTWTYPARATVVAIGLAVVVICSLNVCRFMRREAESVERFSKQWNMEGISDAHDLLKLRKLLREPNISAKNDEMVLKDFLALYRKVYDALPERMKAKEESNNLRLERKSQLFLLRTPPLRHGILFIIHDDRAPDGSVKITDYPAIPTIEEVKQIIGESIPDKHINLVIRSVRDWTDGKGDMHNADGYGGAGAWETNEKGSSWYLFLPLGDQYRSIIRDNLDLKGLL